MKLRTLQIDSYRHLQKLTFDFTYPKGHSKFGQPLEKICIIGQSATGKTSVLDLIKQTISTINSAEVISSSVLLNYNLAFDGELIFQQDNSIVSAKKRSVVVGEREFTVGQASGSVGRLIQKDLKLLYFSAEIISKEIIEIFNQNPVDILNKLGDDKNSNIPLLSEHLSVYQFGQELNARVWYSLLSKVLDYRKGFTQMAAELINKGSIGDMARLNREFKIWSEANRNPLVEFATNSILF